WPTPRTAVGGRWPWPTRAEVSTWSGSRCPRRPRGPRPARRSRPPASPSGAARCCATSTSSPTPRPSPPCAPPTRASPSSGGGAVSDVEASVEAVFAHVFRGHPCVFAGPDVTRLDVPADAWTGTLDGDAAVLDLCTGPTLDVGCGPGRMTP